MMRLFRLVPLFLFPGLISLGALPLDLWKAPLGTPYEECLKIWAGQGIIPDLKADGPAFSRTAEVSLVFFRFRPFQGFLAQDIQAVFSRGALTQVRVVYRKNQNPQSYFDTYFREIKKSLDATYFPANKSLGFVKTGAAWIFPGGETVYMGSILPTELVVIMDGRPSQDSQGEKGLFPRS